LTTPFEPLDLMVDVVEPTVVDNSAPIEVTPTAEPAAPLPVRPCPRCGGPVDVRTRHLAIQGSTVRAYCSQACATATSETRQVAKAPPPRRTWMRALGHLGLGVPMLFFTSGPGPRPIETPAPAAAVGVAPAPAAPELPTFG